MKRTTIALGGLLCVMALIVGCSGDDGQQGVMGTAGADGSPQAIKVLVAGGDLQSELEAILIAWTSEDAFPTGTQINYVNISDSIPPLSLLNQYDAVMVYSQSATWNFPTEVGDVVANYVDAGGGVLLAQGCFITPTFALEGRIMTAGYSPFQAVAVNGQAGDRTIDFTSLSIPLHPVFAGTDVQNLVYEGGAFLSNPTLSTGATLIATNVNGHNALAINANGRVMATNIWISGTFGDATETDARRLLANCLLFVGGGI